MLVVCRAWPAKKEMAVRLVRRRRETSSGEEEEEFEVEEVERYVRDNKEKDVKVIALVGRDLTACIHEIH
jgi:hypothetical protein